MATYRAPRTETPRVASELYDAYLASRAVTSREAMHAASRARVNAASRVTPVLYDDTHAQTARRARLRTSRASVALLGASAPFWLVLVALLGATLTLALCTNSASVVFMTPVTRATPALFVACGVLLCLACVARASTYVATHRATRARRRRER